MSEEIRHLRRDVDRLQRELAQARAALRLAQGRLIAERYHQGESLESVASCLGITRQYAHKLMSEAGNA